jgi:hypothetical protein
VRIDPLDLKSVVFLCSDGKPDQEGNTRFPRGTAFFVTVKSETDPGVSWDYLVTARHNVDDDTHPDSIWVRINRKDGKGFKDVETERRRWRCHQDADVAAILAPLPAPDLAGQLDYQTIPLETFVGPGPEYTYSGGGAGSTGVPARVSIGDDIFALGLFVQEHGKEINLPVARFGHVSRMPSIIKHRISRSSLSGDTLQDVVAYLAEFLSWGGISGSPVFWLYPMHPKLLPEARGAFKALLGLVSGHFFIYERVVVTDHPILGCS